MTAQRRRGPHAHPARVAVLASGVRSGLEQGIGRHRGGGAGPRRTMIFGLRAGPYPKRPEKEDAMPAKVGTREEWQAARDELAKLEAEHAELGQQGHRAAP